MSNPQIENGYTKIANELMDALGGTRVPGEARQVLDVIIRKTYGFNKKSDDIALSQFVNTTGLKKPAVVRAIKKLLDMNMIRVIKKDNKTTTNYSFNKHYKAWKPLSKKITLSKKTTGVIEKDKASLSKKIHTKETTTKETLTKDIVEQFEIFWNLYDHKKSKKKTLAKWVKLTDDERSACIDAVPAYVASTPNKQFRMHPLTYLNGNNWEDEITLTPEQEKEMEMLEKEVEEAERIHKQLYGLDFREDGSHVKEWEKEAERLGIDVREYGKWRSDYSDANGKYSEQRPLPEKEYPEV